MSAKVEPRKAVDTLKLVCSYRKPTQVGGVSILRCTGEPSFRNSAKKWLYLRKKAFPTTVIQ